MSEQKQQSRKDSRQSGFGAHDAALARTALRFRPGRRRDTAAHNPRGNASVGVIVLTGPTAVGKGTVEHALLAKHPEVWVSVSATTRAPRPGEKNGVDYWFVTDEQFAQMRRENKFLETAIVHNMAHYGTPLQPVLDHLKQNVPTILEIDLQGARRVRTRAAELGIDVLFVFLAPPSFDDLVTRLAERGTENEEQRMKRLASAHVEMAAEDEFDVVIVNGTVEKAADKLWQVIRDEYGLAG